MPRPWGWVGSPRRVTLAESYYFHGTRKEEGDHDRLGSPGQSSALPRRSRARRLAFRVHPTAPDPSIRAVPSSLQAVKRGHRPGADAARRRARAVRPSTLLGANRTRPNPKGVPGYARVAGCHPRSAIRLAHQQRSVPAAFDIRTADPSRVNQIGGSRDSASVGHSVECHRPGRLGVFARRPDDLQVHMGDELTRLAGHGRARGTPVAINTSPAVVRKTSYDVTFGRWAGDERRALFASRAAVDQCAPLHV
jgi:hypothetical protein